MGIWRLRLATPSLWREPLQRSQWRTKLGNLVGNLLPLIDRNLPRLADPCNVPCTTPTGPLHGPMRRPSRPKVTPASSLPSDVTGSLLRLPCQPETTPSPQPVSCPLLISSAPFINPDGHAARQRTPDLPSLGLAIVTFGRGSQQTRHRACEICPELCLFPFARLHTQSSAHATVVIVTQPASRRRPNQLRASLHLPDGLVQAEQASWATRIRRRCR